MKIFFYISHFTLQFILLFTLLPPPAATVDAVNVTGVLAGFPDLAEFTRLLASTGVAGELSKRSSLTLLAVPNTNLVNSTTATTTTTTTTTTTGADIADVLRCHVLLEYLSPSDLLRLPSSGKLVTTLFQTTGRAASNLGVVNVTTTTAIAPPGTANTRTTIVKSPNPFSSTNATILNFITAVPYNLSIFTVDSLLIPSGFDLAASETRPPAAVNITRVLIDARGFNVAASMLEASGVAEEFEADERGAGITVFVPTDEAFAGLPATERLQSLPADQKAVVLRYHVLHSYYPLGSLQSIVNPVQPTLATEEETEAGRFTLNITRVNGSVAIDTGVVQASITRTVFDQNPVAIFAVSKVLLPKEFFGRRGDEESPELAVPPPAMAPETYSVVEAPPTRLSAPPGLRGGATAATSAASSRKVILWWCIGLVHLVRLLLLV